MSDRREATLRRLGIVPSVADLLRVALDDAVGRAEAGRAAGGGTPPAVTVLDAGCGRNSALARYRARIGRFVGVDIHAPPPGALPYLDDFATIDLCANPDAFPAATFDLVLSSFTVEHFAAPGAAFANIAGWLRPGGSLVLTTVNRRHPFVAAYLGVPDGLRRRVQPVVKATAADAHPLVGACNDPGALRRALAAAGYQEIRVVTVGHLARAWRRRLPTFVLGLVGDLLARDIPSRRSTLVVTARAPGPAA
ncbi:MAG TPA: class I SAM-dependent methyltransferase [Candidatus Nanopelagicales bacterium]|nr:class I SAM-dependent methyltransferase [Candidatus Nanopelagicales bacterium]